MGGKSRESLGWVSRTRHEAPGLHPDLTAHTHLHTQQVYHVLCGVCSLSVEEVTSGTAPLSVGKVLADLGNFNTCENGIVKILSFLVS